MKVHYLPLYMISYLPEYDRAIFTSRFKEWIAFLRSQEMLAPPNCSELIQQQITAGEQSSFSRQILKLPISLGSGTCNFELILYGGIQPSCSGGFVQCTSLRFTEKILDEIVKLALADVLVFAASGATDKVRVLGSAWGTYLYLKLDKLQPDSEKRRSKVRPSATVTTTFLATIKEEIGNETMSYTWPDDVPKINSWLAEHDARMSSTLKETLMQILFSAGLSLEQWQKVREAGGGG